MANNNNGNQKNKKGMPIVAGVTGAVIGAGVAVAASKVLSNKKTREAVVKKAGEIKDTVMDAVSGVEENAKEMGNNAKSKMSKKK